MANVFRSILLRLQSKTVTAGTSASTVSTDTGYDGLSSVTVNPTPSETKTQAAGTSNIDVTPTSGKLLSKVTVTPTPSETKTQAPGTTAVDVTPSSGKLLSKVTVSAIQTETKSQAAGTSNIDVTPTSGKYLTKVTVTPQQHSGYYPASGSNITSNGTKDLGASHNYRYVNVNVPSPTLSGDAAVGNVLSGKTFYNTSTTKQTGAMTNRGAWTSTGNNCNASTTKDVTIPEGYHNGSGYVRFNSLSSQTGVDSGKTAIDASHVHSGYQGWVNGSKVSGTYTPPTITSLAPSDSNPPALETTKNYNPTSAGYAIENAPTTLTPDNTTPATITSGTIYRASDNGYAYSSKPTKTETTLWTNSAPNSNFTSGSSKTITLSQDFTDFDYIKITWKASIIKTMEASILVDPTTLTQSLTGSSNKNNPPVMIGGRTNTTSGYGIYARRVTYVSNTQLAISIAQNQGASGDGDANAIPLSIIGINFVGIDNP